MDMITARDLEALKFIRNRLAHGRQTTVRELASHLDISSPTSASVCIDKLVKHGLLKRNESGRGLMLTSKESVTAESEATVSIPLVGDVACGNPLEAIERADCWFDVSTRIAPLSHKHYFLRAKGDSMNCAQRPIEDGWLVLVRCQETAPEGEMVVGLINDKVTIKCIKYADDCVFLLPKSSNPTHRPIIASDNFQIQGIAIKAFPPASLLQSDGGEAVS